MNGRHSISGLLTRYVMFGFAAMWLLALVATALVLRSEQDELADITIQRTAQVFLPQIAADFRQRGADPVTLPIETGGTRRFDPVNIDEDAEDALIYRLLDGTGAALMRSAAPPGTVYPETAQQGHARTVSHVFYTTFPNHDGFVMQIGDLRSERAEAYRDSFLALLIPMLAILPLCWLLVGWIGRRALAPLDRLRSEIAQRGDTRLDPIDAGGQADELRAITASLNGFMIRLSTALEGERAFATSAAHELRTPVAVALAQVQRMRAEGSGADPARLIAIEEALKRMTRLVVRLLQMARAEAGIGLSETPQDIAGLLDLILDDSRRDPARAVRLHVDLPDAPVLSRIDPDAFAMLSGNLIDNAFQHAPPDTAIHVALSPTGWLSVTNDSPVIAAPELLRLTKRFQRGTVSGNGFGLGLCIVDTIARHTGGTFKLSSPPEGRDSGFQAMFHAPPIKPVVRQS